MTVLPLRPLVLVVALAGCPSAPRTEPAARRTADSSTFTSQPPASQPGGAGAMTRIPDGDRLYSSTSSGFEESAQRVVRDRATWEDVWRQLHGGAATAAPAVDFARDVVVLVAAGMRNSGGHAVRVDGTTASGNDLTVHATFVSPGASCMTTQHITYPAEAVRVRRPAGGEVRVVTRAETTPG